LHAADWVDLHTGSRSLVAAASLQLFTLARASPTILLQLMLKIAKYRKG
jgi:hypothetical protein